MNKTNNGNLAESGKKSLFEYFTEIVGWLQIIAAPFLTGLAVGLIIYFSLQNKAGLIIAIVIATIGLIAGIVWQIGFGKRKELFILCQGSCQLLNLTRLKMRTKISVTQYFWWIVRPWKKTLITIEFPFP